MIRYAIFMATTVLYGVLGSYLEHNSYIVEPAYFSLYGVVFGAIFMFLLEHKK
jgi:hypothetical protein